MRIVTTNVICGFPGIGKTYLASKFPVAARDLESLMYHWKNGDKKNGINIRWPENYVNDVKLLDSSGMYRVIMLSTHEDMRACLAKEKIKYTNIYVEDTPKMKEIMFNRYRLRGSTESFLEIMDKNFSDIIHSLKNDKNSVANIQLTPSTLTQWDGWVMME